jgi:hypothetical protein
MDVKIVIVHGNLHEKMHMEQPPNYVNRPLLQNVIVIHESMFTRPMNSLLSICLNMG